jgi:hypothetical protein
VKIGVSVFNIPASEAATEVSPQVIKRYGATKETRLERISTISTRGLKLVINRRRSARRASADVTIAAAKTR